MAASSVEDPGADQGQDGQRSSYPEDARAACEGRSARTPAPHPGILSLGRPQPSAGIDEAIKDALAIPLCGALVRR
jgi:hypothetical protein